MTMMRFKFEILYNLSKSSIIIPN